MCKGQRELKRVLLQIFPIHVKGAAGSLVVLVNWLGAWAVSYTFNFLMRWSASGTKIKAFLVCTVVQLMTFNTPLFAFSSSSFPGTFFIYSAFSVMTVLFVAKLVPETKGKTLEEIQASTNS